MSTKMFEDNEAIDAFTQTSDYGIGKKKLCFGVVMQKNNVGDKYQYLLRYNISNTPGKEDIPNTGDDRVDQILQ